MQKILYILMSSFIALIILYTMLPFGNSEYKDIASARDYNYNKQSFMEFSKKDNLIDFVENVQNIQNGNTGSGIPGLSGGLPEAGKVELLWPSVDVNTNGQTGNGSAYVWVTSGYIRNTSNSLHGAIDAQIKDHIESTACAGPHGRSGSGYVCPHTAIVAPVSGKVTFLRNKGQPFLNVTISPDSNSAFAGTQVTVLHMWDIPSTITNGCHVEQGQHIGYQCGSYGYTSHVHMHIKVNGKYMKIQDWFPRVSLHSSISKIIQAPIDGVVDPTEDRQGYTISMLEDVTNKPKVDISINIDK